MDKLSVEEFGRQLIETGDLDPIYVMLNNSTLTLTGKAKFCLAYWCFYHAGFAAYACDRTDEDPHSGAPFWDTMIHAAHNDMPCVITKDGRWPRGTERRHFRGAAGIRSVKYLAEKFPNPVDAIRWIAFGHDPGVYLDFEYVFKRVQEWPAFGPWIGFKVADMMDACLGYYVDFTDTEKYFFDDPKRGAVEAFKELNGLHAMASWESTTKVVVLKLRQLLADTRIHTPSGPRPPRTQEIETVLCMWKAHRNGHYPVGKDTREILKGLGPWAHWSHTASHLHNVLWTVANDNNWAEALR